ncbi:putative bifunctional diguanylate cyclase/phosphodiesterase [Chachezhania sediminis]|uniref:putative bifunctional diguanylate cyclase/phosphodiesterase n=1 Tax=Chachezhania sediminis TaxID=2599291 RepID=UPI00131B3D89|nr:GGDEF domain-containing phosphodiesterase [Chachezhania sediminis]
MRMPCTGRRDAGWFLPGLPRRAGVRLVAVVTWFIGPAGLAFLPALVLGAFWLGGEAALVIVALGLPLVIALAGGFHPADPQRTTARDGASGLMLRDGFEDSIADIYLETAAPELRSACFVLEISDWAKLTGRLGTSAVDELVLRVGERILAALRQGDVVARIGENRFGICLAAGRTADLELCVQIAGRLQATVEDGYSVEGMAMHPSCAIGFCLRSRVPGPDGPLLAVTERARPGEAAPRAHATRMPLRPGRGRDVPGAVNWLGAAEAALDEARVAGPSAIRAYTTDLHRRTRARTSLRADAENALENGQILAWFQPQISTDTGRISGFEALARWEHPEQGVLSPERFMPALAAAGRVERLGRVMLFQSLSALAGWDKAGVEVPGVAVNFATEELRSPGLLDRVRWELERFGIAPERLCIEILETVVSDRPQDTVARNISGLAAMGCRIDLDDFGTGHSSIAAIRRFDVSRIKIDRSFVTRADRDPEQQKMIAAILTMAERLELRTLAEGVETVGEHALLSQLGCDHVQGFGIGRPMPFAETLVWIDRHNAKIQDAPIIGRSVG